MRSSRFFPLLILSALVITAAVARIASAQVVLLNNFQGPEVVGPFTTVGSGNYQVAQFTVLPNHNVYVSIGCDAIDTVNTAANSWRRDVYVFDNSGGIAPAVFQTPENYTTSIAISSNYGTPGGNALTLDFETTASDALRVICVLYSFSN